MKKYILLILFLSIPFLPSAQEEASPKLDPYLRASLEKKGAGAEMNLFVKGEQKRIERYFRSREGRIKFQSGGYSMVRMEAQKVRSFQKRSFVDRILVQMGEGRALNDTMRIRNRIRGIQQGNGLPRSYRGEDVILGYIDSGIELDHPDFQDPNGRTRVLTLWDQTLSDSSNTPSKYGYGQEWDSTDINAGNCPHVDQSGYNGHGSSVASVGSGNGLATGNHRGGAPRSDLIIVSNDFNAPNWTASIVDAVDYILSRADSMGKPVVVNTSLGTYLGSHDAKDPASLMIDSLIEASSGSMLVAAAGNAGHIPFHLGYDVTQDTNFTWFEYNNNSGLGYGAVYFEAWADTSAFNNVEYAVGADRVNPSFLYRGRTPFHTIQNNLDSTISDTLLNGSGDTLAIVQTYAQRLGSRYKVQVHLKEPDSSQYYYRFMTTGSGSFDVWSADFLGSSSMVDSSGLPPSSDFPDITDYRAPDRRKTIVGSWACSEEVLTVANYTGRVEYPGLDSNTQTVSGTPGEIANNSSRGPTRQGRNKPDIAATGNVLMTAGKLSFIDYLIQNEPYKVHPDSMHMRNGGTSVAAPVLSAIGGLYFQRCPGADHQEVMKAIRTTARTDSFTGSVPNARWGHGKVDGRAALAQSLYAPQLDYSDTSSCGSPIPLSTQDSYSAYSWSDGSSGSPLSVDSSGSYYAEVFDSSACPARTDTVDLEIFPLPPEPTLYQQGDSLFTDMSGVNYQWFRDGSPIPSATEQGHRIEQEGAFYLVVEDSNGCRNRSDTLNAIPSFLEDRAEKMNALISPNPTGSRFKIQLSRPARTAFHYRLIGPDGRKVRSGTIPRGAKEERTELKGCAPGLYILEWQHGDKKGRSKVMKE